MDSELAAGLKTLTEEAMAEYHVPGVAVGIWGEGQEWVA